MSQLRKNISYNLMLSIAQVIFPVFSIPYISRVLTPTNLGQVNFVDSLSYYFVILATLGVHNYGIREVARYRANKTKISKSISGLLSIHIMASLAFLIPYWIVVACVYSKINNFSLVIFSSVFIIANAFTCEWYFLGTEKFRYIAWRTLLSRLTGLICIFLFVKTPDDYYIYYAIMVGSVLFISCWNMKILLGEITFRFSFKNWKKIFLKTRVMYYTALLYCFSMMLDNVLLGLVATTAAVSIYTLSSKVVRLSASLITDAFYVLYPNSISTLHQNGKEAHEKLVYSSFQWICIIAIPLCFGIFLFADDFSAIYFGPTFQEVVIGLKLLCIYPLLKATGLFFDKQFLMPANKEVFVFRSLLISVLIFIPANLLLSGILSYKGTCIAVLIAELTVTILNYYYSKKHCASFRIVNYKNLLQVFIGTILFIPVFYSLKLFIHEPLIFLPAAIVCCSGIYVLFLWVIKNEFVIQFSKTLKPFRNR